MSTSESETETAKAAVPGEVIETPADDSPPSLGFRIVRTLMLLASSIVVVVALPLFAWQTTTLAEQSVDVAGEEFTIRVVKRHGELAVRFEPHTGEPQRFPLVDSEGRSIELDGKPSIGLEEDGRRVEVLVGSETRRFEFRDGAYVPSRPR